MTSLMAGRMESLVLMLRTLSDEIEPDLFAVTQQAREEWRALQKIWSSDGRLRPDETNLTEDQLEALSAKARRFRAIVHGLALRRPAESPPLTADPISEPTT